MIIRVFIDEYCKEFIKEHFIKPIIISKKEYKIENKIEYKIENLKRLQSAIV